MSDGVYVGLDSFDVGQQQKNTHSVVYYLFQKLQEHICRHLVKISMMAQLHRESMCSNCHRSGDSPSHGAAINSRGCTGACLKWAREIMEHPHRFRYEPTWPDWPDIVARLRIVCSDINELGCGYLFWGCRSVSPDIRYKYDWIEQARERYCESQKYSDPEEYEAWWAAEGREFYDIVNMLHQQCLKLPTVVYTLHWAPQENNSCHVRMTTMNGDTVNQASVPCDEPFQAWKHVPPPPYRVAADGNLYSFEDYAAYYGEAKCKEFWTRDAPCYDHLIHLITESGDVLQWSAPIMILLNETDQCIVLRVMRGGFWQPAQT